MLIGHHRWYFHISCDWLCSFDRSSGDIFIHFGPFQLNGISQH